MNAPPHEVNITLLENADGDGDGGRLVDYRRNASCTTNASIADAKQSPCEQQKTIQKNQHILKIREKGNLPQNSATQALTTVKEEKEEEVYFCLRGRILKRSELNLKEESNSITNDRNNFELPETYHGVLGATEPTKPKTPTSRNRLSTFSLVRTKSVDRSISEKCTRTTNGSVGEGHSSIHDRKTPFRTVSEPIQVQKRREINVTISPRRSSPRKIHDCANLDYSTGLEGIELLRQASRIRLSCGSDSKLGWVDQQSLPYPPTPNNMFTKNDRFRRKKRSNKYKGNSDGSAAWVSPEEESCESSHCTTLSASSREISVVSRQEALDADAEVRRKCYTWYARLGQPKREQMKRRIARMSSNCDIKPSDVDKLAWICNGERISISAMNESLVRSSSRERQEMAVESTTKESAKSARNVLARRYPSRTKSRRVPTRSVSENLQIISKKAKELQAGEASCESTQESKRKDSVGIARARPCAPTRAVSDSFRHKKIERKILEGLSLQKMLDELRRTSISSRPSCPRSQADPPSSEKEVPTPVLILKKIQPLALEKPRREVLAKRKRKHAGPQSAEEMTRSPVTPTRTMQPSQKHFEFTVLDTRPVQALSATMIPVEQATSGVSHREHKEASLDGYFAGDRTSIQCAQLVVSDNGKSLDPIVASFLGLGRADKVRIDEQRKKARRPEFVQALSFFSAKKTTAATSSADSSSARRRPIRKLSRAISAMR